MKRLATLTAAAALAAILSSGLGQVANAISGPIFAASGDGRLATIAPDGTVSVIGDGGVVFCDIAFDPAGTLYGRSCVSSANGLYTIDTTDASVALIASAGATINGLVFRSDGTLFGSGGGQVYTINLVTAATTALPSPIGGGCVSSGDLEFDASANLYLTCQNGNLVTINQTTGVGTVVGNMGAGDVFGLAFTNNKMFGMESAPQRIFEIDLADASRSNINAFNIDFNPFGAATQPLEELSKALISGPDVDGDSEIDVVVPTLTFPDTVLDPYDFTITYVPEDDTDVLIVDVVPAEWQVKEIETVGPNDDLCFVDIPDGEGGLADAGPGNDKCDREKSATIIEWTPVPTVAVSTLNVVADTRQSPSGKNKFKPTACGPLFLNDGAEAFELDGGELIIPLVSIAGPTDPICLAAVDDPDGTSTGPGADRSATADHDTDTLASFAEACTNVPRTDPCLTDTDLDTVADNVDNCPLISNVAGQGDDADSDGVGLVCDANDANDTIGVAQCADGIDNDGDGRIDHSSSALSDKGGDSQCISATDNDESG